MSAEIHSFSQANHVKKPKPNPNSSPLIFDKTPKPESSYDKFIREFRLRRLKSREKRLHEFLNLRKKNQEEKKKRNQQRREDFLARRAAIQKNEIDILTKYEEELHKEKDSIHSNNQSESGNIVKTLEETVVSIHETLEDTYPFNTDEYLDIEELESDNVCVHITPRKLSVSKSNIHGAFGKNLQSQTVTKENTEKLLSYSGRTSVQLIYGETHSTKSRYLSTYAQQILRKRNRKLTRRMQNINPNTVSTITASGSLSATASKTSHLHTENGSSYEVDVATINSENSKQLSRNAHNDKTYVIGVSVKRKDRTNPSTRAMKTIEFNPNQLNRNDVPSERNIQMRRMNAPRYAGPPAAHDAAVQTQNDAAVQTQNDAPVCNCICLQQNTTKDAQDYVSPVKSIIDALSKKSSNQILPKNPSKHLETHVREDEGAVNETIKLQTKISESFKDKPLTAIAEDGINNIQKEATTWTVIFQGDEQVNNNLENDADLSANISALSEKVIENKNFHEDSAWTVNLQEDENKLDLPDKNNKDQLINKENMINEDPTWTVNLEEDINDIPVIHADDAHPDQAKEPIVIQDVLPYQVIPPTDEDPTWTVNLEEDANELHSTVNITVNKPGSQLQPIETINDEDKNAIPPTNEDPNWMKNLEEDKNDITVIHADTWTVNSEEDANELHPTLNIIVKKPVSQLQPIETTKEEDKNAIPPTNEDPTWTVNLEEDASPLPPTDNAIVIQDPQINPYKGKEKTDEEWTVNLASTNDDVDNNQSDPNILLINEIIHKTDEKIIEPCTYIFYPKKPTKSAVQNENTYLILPKSDENQIRNLDENNAIKYIVHPTNEDHTCTLNDISRDYTFDKIDPTEDDPKNLATYAVYPRKTNEVLVSSNINEQPHPAMQRMARAIGPENNNNQCAEQDLITCTCLEEKKQHTLQSNDSKNTNNNENRRLSKLKKKCYQPDSDSDDFIDYGYFAECKKYQKRKIKEELIVHTHKCIAENLKSLQILTGELTRKRIRGKSCPCDSS